MTGDPRTREHPFSPMPGSRCAECNGYADEHGLLDADPDAPTHCANCGQHVRPNAPHKLGECNPDDAPADTDLSETLARHLQVAMTETGFMPDICYCREIAAILVAAGPWRAQVEAKALEDAAEKSRHRDAFAADGVDIFLLQLADDIRKEHGLHPYRRGARGETRQP